MEVNVSTTVNVNGVRGDIERRNGVVEHVKVLLEHVPVGLGDAITGLPAVDCCKFERPVNDCVEMSEVEPFAERA